MRGLEKRLAQLEERRQRAIDARQPKITLTDLYRIMGARRAAGQPPLRNRSPL